MVLSLLDAQALAARSAGMSADETVNFLTFLMEGSASPDEGGALLKTWSARKETGLELAAAVRFLRERAITVPTKQPGLDLCGTGGSGLSRYNVSTTVAFIVAAAGIVVAKHGNRGSKRPNGSFDLLDALGVPFDLSPEQQAELQQESGVCFLFARSHHPAVGKVVPYRKAAGGRTIFNLAGPLANPAPIRHQVIGTVDSTTARIVADALARLNEAGSLVIWGHPGVDEISVTGPTGMFAVHDGQITRGELGPALHPGMDYAELPGGDAPENAATFHRLLSGEESGPLLDMVVESAGVCLDLWKGRAPRLSAEGAVEARQLIASGAARATFERHRELARKMVES